MGRGLRPEERGEGPAELGVSRGWKGRVRRGLQSSVAFVDVGDDVDGFGDAHADGSGLGC